MCVCNFLSLFYRLDSYKVRTLPLLKTQNKLQNESGDKNLVQLTWVQNTVIPHLELSPQSSAAPWHWLGSPAVPIPGCTSSSWRRRRFRHFEVWAGISWYSWSRRDSSSFCGNQSSYQRFISNQLCTGWKWNVLFLGHLILQSYSYGIIQSDVMLSAIGSGVIPCQVNQIFNIQIPEWNFPYVRPRQ
jgi:hypothetical protein